MENRTTRQHVNGGDQASSRSENTLPGPIEAALEEIYRKHNLGPINDETRQRLSLVSEELASDTLRKVLNSQHVKTTHDRFINFFLDKATNGSSQSPAARHRPREEMSLDSEAPSPKCMKIQGDGESLHIPQQMLALSELEFKKAFLLLSYIPGNSLAQVITADEIRQWKDLPMVAYEVAVWNRLGRLYCSQTDRRVSLEWDSGKTHYYQCHVALDRSYTLKSLEWDSGKTHYYQCHVALDGSYTLKLLEHFKPSEPWVSLTPPTKGNSARKPSHLSPKELEEELFDMFLKARFHASNVIGMAADSWLAIMDRFLILGDESAEEKAEMKKKMLKLTDMYYNALDAPKKGAKVYLPEELKPDIFPHYMERDQKFKSTSILGMICDFVKSQTAEEHTPSSEISKLSCFKDEPVSDLYKEKCGQLYKKYRKEMFQALRDKDESASEVIQRHKQEKEESASEVIQRHKQEKDESASEVIERYKQEFYGAAGFEDSKKSLKELYLQALALYNIVYDYAIEKEKVGYSGFVWKVAGPVLCRFYLEKTQGKSLVCSPAVVKELWG